MPRIANGPIRFGDHGGRRRFPFTRFDHVDASPVCIYNWIELGRLRICADYD
jgi:hypothetical protein